MNTREILVGAGVGAALAFMLDPQGGGRRRAVVRDKVVRASRKSRDGVDAVARDMANRTRGVAAATRGRFTGGDVDDDVLVERVRAKLGRASSHPRAIDVKAGGGEVTLYGPILAGEVDGVLSTVAAVRGVRSVINELEPHDSPEGIPSLQGHGRVGGPSLDILQRNWAPATQALVGMAALAATSAVIAYSSRRSHAA
jgi:gas vesicle protein